MIAWNYTLQIIGLLCFFRKKISNIIFENMLTPQIYWTMQLQSINRVGNST